MFDGGNAYELKSSHGERIPFSHLAEHQLVALMTISSGVDVFSYKISDSAIGYKPFDCFSMMNCKAWLVLGFNDGAYVYAVPVQKIMDLVYDEQNKRRRGSVTRSQARCMGSRIVL